MTYKFTDTPTKHPLTFAELKVWIATKYGFDNTDKITIKDGEIGWWGTDGIHAVGVWFPINPTELSFFFDSLEIVGSLDYDPNDGRSYATFEAFIDHWYGGDVDLLKVGDFPTRESALVALYDKCFEIAEEKLRKEQPND